MKLRPYQEETVGKVLRAWLEPDVKDILVQMATGTGKTPTAGAIIKRRGGGAVFIAHRSQLVSQGSIALAMYGIRHRVIGSTKLVAECSRLHLMNRKIGVNYVDRSAPVAVAGVNTLVGMDPRDPIFTRTLTVITDEGHHLLAENIWGRARGMFVHPEVRGLSLTATPGRPDGKGLGRHADGLIDLMISGAQMGWAMKAGYLTPYKVFNAPSDVDYSQVKVTASGDLSPPQLSAAVHKSKKIVGDIVDTYLQRTPGKLGLTFCVDVQAATEVAAEFNRKGVKAAVITGDTDPLIRMTVMEKFRARECLQICSVDILGEGTDIPAVEVVSMARRTESFIVFAQQLGRMVRLMLPDALAGAWDTYTDAQRRQFIAESDKPFGVLLDHAGNFARHGPPQAEREWTLDAADKRSRGAAPSDVEPQRTCLNPNGMLGEGIPCMFTYSRVLDCCPECEYVPKPATRSAPEHVDGVLTELDPAVLAGLMGDVADVDTDMPQNPDAPLINAAMPPAGQAAARKRHYAQHDAARQAHYDRKDAQAQLRPVMATWGGWRAVEGDTTSMTQRRFFHAFGVDVMTAQALGANEADALRGRIEAALASAGIAVD